MRTWFWMLLLLVAAVGAAIGVRYHTGNVALLLPPYRIELSASLAALILLVAFAVFYAALRAVAWTFGLPTRVRRWRARRALAQQQELLERGWINLLEGRFARAETDMDKVAEQTDVPARRVLATLSAARAAQAMQEYERRDQFLARAREAAESDDTLKPVISVVEADMLLAQRRPAEALALLSQLHESGPRHMHTLSLTLKAQRELGHWPEVLRLARVLAKRKVLHTAAGTRMIAKAAAELVRAAPDESARRTFWKSLRDEERVLPEVALAAAAAFEADGASDRARQILEEALGVELSPALLHVYARCDAAQIPARLDKAEQWLKQAPRDPDLLQCLGTLCLCGHLWGPAQRYLERSLAERDDPRSHALLASVFDHTDRPADAVREWRLATDGVVALPSLVRQVEPDTFFPAPSSASLVVPDTALPGEPDRSAGL